MLPLGCRLIYPTDRYHLCRYSIEARVSVGLIVIVVGASVIYWGHADVGCVASPVTRTSSGEVVGLLGKVGGDLCGASGESYVK